MSIFSKFTYKILKIIRSPKLILIKKNLGSCGKDVVISMPCRMSKPQNVFMGDYTLIQPNCSFIMNKGKVFVGKWSTLSSNTIIITDNHRPTVGVNTRMLNRYAINDEVRDIHINEDCWIGARSTLLSGATIGRGAIIATGAVVNKDVPPYAVVAGIPAKIIATVFSKEQIIEHEKCLYSEKDRLAQEEIDALFEKYYVGKKSIGIEGVTEEGRLAVINHKYMQESILQ